MNVGSDGSFTLTYDTAGKGITPSGNAQTLTVKYGGSDALNEGTATVSITLNPKAVTAEVTNTITKAYDGTASATVELAVNSGLVSSDTVTGTATGTYAGFDVGTGITVTVNAADVTWSGDTQWYSITLPTGITGEITAATITSQPQISGEAVYGQTLTAAYTPAIGETVTFQWNRDGEAISGATGTTYTVAAADVGCAITVTAMATDSNHTGSTTSQSVAAGKAGQTAPSAAPELASRTTSSITLKEIKANANGAAAEYGISTDGGETWAWQDSPVFTKLSSGTEYTFAARYGAVDSYNASDPSPTAQITTSARSYSESGGSATPTYKPTVEKAENGSAAVSPTNPKQGDTVTITATPDQGYEVDEVIVTDRNGDTIRVKDKGDGVYTFTMPASKVEVKVTFVETDTACDGGEDCPSYHFADVDSAAWYHLAVDYVVENGLMSGYGNGLFGPNDALSRAQLAQILYNQEGQPGVTGGSSFADVADGAWHGDAVTWAAANGIVTGYGNGLFGPDDPITREQLAVMLWRYARFKGYDTTQGGMVIREFSDYESVSGYAMDAMTWAVNTGVISGYEDQTLRPQANATRAQAAQMLKNFFEDT